MNNDLEYLVKENCLLVGVNEYLKMFNIGRATFYRYKERGILPPYFKKGNKIFLKLDLRKYKRVMDKYVRNHSKLELHWNHSLIDFNRLCKICGYKMLSIKCDGNNKYKVFFGGNAHKIAFFIDNKKNVRFTEYIAFTRIVKKSLKR